MKHRTRIWYLPRYDKSRRRGVCTTATAGSDANLPLRIQHKLGKWDSRRNDFYSSVDDPPRPLHCYCEKQQDACQYSHDGPLAAIDGSLSLRKERMGTSFAFVEKPGSALSLQFSAPVGGSLATLRAEAIGSHFERAIPLLVFIDCLVLLQIFTEMGPIRFLARSA